MSHVAEQPLTHQVVRASAGAGKTYQLTTRYLDLIARHEQPQNILATTFTRKAAGEVLARVLGRLAGACADDNARQELCKALKRSDLPQRECIGMLRSLTDRLNRLSVGTIDGFFNRAARALALDLNLPTDPRLIDEGSPLAQQMRFDAIQAVLGEQAADDDGMNTLIEMLRRLHHDDAQRSVTEAIDSIVKDLSEVYRSYPDQSLWDQLPSSGLLTADLLTVVLEALEGMRESVPVSAKGVIYSLFQDKYEQLLADARVGHWDDVLANGLVVKVDEKAEKYGHAPIDSAWQQAIWPLAVHAKSVRLRALADQTRATYALLALFDRHYQAVRYGQGVLLFSDLTHVLAEGLPGMGDAGIEELCYRLDAKVTHLLLDEFQDTSLRQWAVLEPFAQQIAATGDDSRSLFCVGDTKQAIYGWRGGCAELFDAVQELPGVQPTMLSNSWRSSQVVLDAVNQVFSTLDANAALNDDQRAATAWQKGFETHHAVKKDLPGHVVLRTTAAGSQSDTSEEGDEDDVAAPPDAHAHDVAGYIKELMQTMPGQTIGVLMRSRAKAQTLMYALRSLGVAAAEEGGNPIGQTPAVAAVLSAIQWADHPGDSVSRFHVMNSPMGEVLGLDAQADGEALSRKVRRMLMDRGYAAVIAQWVVQLALSCDAKALGRLMQLIDLADEFDANDVTLRPGFFVQAVRLAKVEDASPARVRVMTIHASKGLEFDAVVLPDLDGMLSAQDKNDLIVLDRDSPISPVRGVYRRARREFVGLTHALEEAHAQRAYEKRTEDLCLLYVAMTRAKQGLHMLVRPLKQGKTKGQPTGKPTGAGLVNLSYAAILRQALRAKDTEGFEGGECLFESGAPWGGLSSSQISTASEPVKRAKFEPIKLVRDQAGMRSWAKTSPSDLYDGARVSVRDLLRIEPSGGQHYGTLMHGLFEKVGFAEEGLPDEALLMRSLQKASLIGIDAQQVLDAFKASLQKPAIEHLLRRDGADELWRERRFVTRLDGRLVEGCFDRVHLWRQGNRYTRALLIDFKTDRVDEHSVAAKAQGYSEQLRLYRAALSAMLGIDPDAIKSKLCFVGDGVVVDVD